MADLLNTSVGLIVQHRRRPAHHRSRSKQKIFNTAEDAATQPGRGRRRHDNRRVFRVVAKHSSANYLPAQTPWLKLFAAGTVVLAFLGYSLRWSLAVAGVFAGTLYYIAFQFGVLHFPEPPSDDV